MEQQDSGAIKYFSPKDSIEMNDSPQHRFDFMLDGKKIGSAEIDYFSKPMPLYQLSDLYVDYDHQGKGYASEIMTQVETFLKERKKPGVLVDGITSGEPAAGMYERRGWKKVPNASFRYVYNWPEHIPLSILDGFEMRYFK